jgi:hypothetical protein
MGSGSRARIPGRTLFAGPSVYNPAVQVYGNSGPTIDSYIIDGTYTVSASEIASPIRVTEAGAGADGTRTFTVEPLYGLQFINPMEFHSPPGAVEWHFFPGDSVGEAPADETYAIRVGDCRYQTTCSFRPPGPGRMQVEVYVETQPARVRSGMGPDGQQEPKLVLTCDSTTLHRGTRIHCRAGTEPAGATVTDLTWEFHDDYGHTITGPAGEDIWAGIMVVDGQMKVSGTVTGKPQIATLAVAVLPRDWTNKVAFPPEPEPEWTKAAPLVYPPTIAGDTLADGTLGLTKYPLPEAATGFGEGTGPNDGWYFFDQAPYFATGKAHIYLNVALRPSDPFYQAQRGTPGHVVMGTPECGPDFMRLAARHVPAHESGHYSRAKAPAESAEGNQMFESAIVFGSSPADDSTACNSMLRRYLEADNAQQADWDKRNVRSASHANSPYPRTEMNRYRILPLLVVLACASVVSPARGQADPDSVNLRNDCRLATQVMRTGDPAPRLQWATSIIHRCGADALADANVAALKRLRSPADTFELEQVWNQLQYVRDGRIYRTALEIAQDRHASTTARVDALLWLQRLRAPNQGATKEDVTGGFDSSGSVRGGCGRYAHIAGTFRYLDGEPLPAGFVAEITQVAGAVSSDPSQPLDVRTAANCAQTLGWGRLGGA